MEVEFTRTWIVLLTSIYSSILALPTFLHIHNWVIISLSTWIILTSFQLTLFLLSSLIVGLRFYQRLYLNSVYNLTIHLNIISIIFGTGSLCLFVSVSFIILYRKTGDFLPGNTTSFITTEENTLSNTLYTQFIASILAWLLFMLELSAEIYGHLGTVAHHLFQSSSRYRESKTHQGNQNTSLFTQASIQKGSTRRDAYRLSTIPERREENEEAEHSSASNNSNTDEEEH